MKSASESGNYLVISYLNLRRAVGFLGFVLPFVLAVGGMLLDGPGFRESISYYYYTELRNYFVGTLCMISMFMFSYRGYERSDAIAGNLAGAFALLVAFCPTVESCSAAGWALFVGRAHLAFATAFFLTLSYFSLVLFTKSDKPEPGRKKRQRNTVYKVCGVTMLAALALIAIYKMATDCTVETMGFWEPVFLLESVTVLAFSVSWIVKGEFILADKPEPPASPVSSPV